MPAFQGDTEKAIKTFRMIGDTAGGNAQKLDTLTDAYTKVLLKGKTSMLELNMIANAGVPIYTELADVMGVSVNTLADMSRKGTISADDLTAAFEKMTGAGGIFYQGMEKSAFTFNAQMLGLRENIGLAAAAIGEKLLPAAKELVGNAVDAADSFIAWAEEGENLNDLLKNLGVVIAGTSAALTTFVAVSKGHAAVTAMAGAVKLLMGALTGPAGIAALAIGGIATAIAAYASYQEKANRAGAIFAEELAATKNKANELLSAYDKLNPGKTLDKKTTEELIKLYPELNAELSRHGLTLDGVRKKLEDYNTEKAKENIAPQIARLQSLIQVWETYQRDLAGVRQEQADLNKYMAENPGVNMEVNQRETEYSINFNIEKVKEAEKDYRDAFERINELAKLYGLKIEENLSITKLPVPSFDNTVSPSLIPDIKPPQNPNNQEGEKESELARILREAREAVKEYGKSETELTEIKLKGLGATASQVAQYQSLAAELQKLKDAEAEREEIKKATEEAQEKEQDYLRQLDELHIKNDEIKNDEAQLLELQRSRMEAEIDASKASDDAKKGSLAALNAYYNEMIKLSNAEFDKKDAEKTEKEKLEKFKKDLAEELDAQRGNIKQRIEILKNGLNEVEKTEGISAENIKLIQKDLTNQIAAETAAQKQMRIDTTLQALSAVQDLTNVFGDIARQQADEKAAQNTARLEAEKVANSKALIDKYNEEISVEGMTEEEKQRIKEQFLDLYKDNEKDYTDAIKEEEEKRKNAAKEAAIVDKVLSAATAGINSFVAFTGALAAYAELGPIAYVQAGAILAAGLAQQAKIVATPITAETGGRFVVPDAPGVDGVGLRVNPGEEINVTPRGEDSFPYVIHNVLMMDRRILYEAVNDGIRSGDIIPLGSNL
jgi:tape measure domain-containing protein